MPRPGENTRIIVPELPHKAEGSPLIRLIGDEFASNAESSLYLLQDLTSAIGGGVLTNNNTITFTHDEDLGYLSGNFDGVNQYLSRATETQFEVGTGSFVASIWFKTSTKGVTQRLFVYGDGGVNEQLYGCEITSANLIQCTIDDGTTRVDAADTIPERWQDGKWHIITMIWDKNASTNGTIFLYVDGQFIDSTAAGTAILTLNNVGEEFLIGALDNAGAIQFFNGELANFHLIKAADYNAVQVLNQGIRERINIGDTVTLAEQAGSRLSNVVTIGGSDGDYAYTMIDVEEGEYELQIIDTITTNQGIREIKIDDVLIQSRDLFNGSTVRNNVTNVEGVKLSAGKHLLRVGVNGKNGSSSGFNVNFYWISLIKREGHEQGGATKFLILGDELQQRKNHINVFSAQTLRFYNQSLTVTEANAIDGIFFEGDLFIKGGLYRIDLIYDKFTNQGDLDLDFGDVEVLDKLDMSAASAQNLVETKLVRLNQGKNNIRFAINGNAGGGTDFVYQITALRGERISD